MNPKLDGWTAMLRAGQARSGQGSYERRAPLEGALGLLHEARDGLRTYVEQNVDDPDGWLLLSEAEESLLDYAAATTALERALSLVSDRDTLLLKRLARLREYQAKRSSFRLTRQQLASLGAFLSHALAVSECDHTHRHTKKWLASSGIKDAARVLRALEKRGGYCDCEVLENVVR